MVKYSSFGGNNLTLELAMLKYINLFLTCVSLTDFKCREWLLKMLGLTGIKNGTHYDKDDFSFGQWV